MPEQSNHRVRIQISAFIIFRNYLKRSVKHPLKSSVFHSLDLDHILLYVLSGRVEIMCCKFVLDSTCVKKCDTRTVIALKLQVL